MVVSTRTHCHNSATGDDDDGLLHNSGTDSTKYHLNNVPHHLNYTLVIFLLTFEREI